MLFVATAAYLSLADIPKSVVQRSASLVLPPTRLVLQLGVISPNCHLYLKLKIPQA